MGNLGGSVSLTVKDEEIIESIDNLAKASNRTSKVSLIVAIIALILSVLLSSVSAYYAFKDDRDDSEWRKSQYEYLEMQVKELKAINTKLELQNEDLKRVIVSGDIEKKSDKVK